MITKATIAPGGERYTGNDLSDVSTEQYALANFEASIAYGALVQSAEWFTSPDTDELVAAYAPLTERRNKTPLEGSQVLQMLSPAASKTLRVCMQAIAELDASDMIRRQDSQRKGEMLVVIRNAQMLSRHLYEAAHIATSVALRGKATSGVAVPHDVILMPEVYDTDTPLNVAADPVPASYSVLETGIENGQRFAVVARNVDTLRS